MTDWPHLRNAPIVEALLDIRVTYRTPPSRTALEAFHGSIREEYPKKFGRVAWESEIQLEENAVQQTARKGPEGFLFRDHEDRRSVQVRQDGFTFNWLKPYDRWDTLRNEARKHWDRYRETFKPESITRLALRYINRLELPLPFSDFREYVLTSPDIAPQLPQGLKTFFMRVEIPEPTHGLVGIVTETIQPPIEDAGGRRLPLILDIDVVREATFAPDSQTVWEIFQHIREYKNVLFFKSLTPKAQALFL